MLLPKRNDPFSDATIEPSSQAKNRGEVTFGSNMT